MTEVLFLGVGSAIPIAGETNSCYLLRTDQACVLIDCGPAILQQLAAVSVSPAEITHIYVTHRHGDHCLGYAMLMLWYTMYTPAGTAPPVIIASELTFKSLDVLMKCMFGAEMAKLAEAAQHIVIPQDGFTRQLTTGITLRSQPLIHHDFAPVMGVRFEVNGKVLAFTGDTLPSANVALLAQDADLLVHDSTYSATLNPEHAAGAYGHSTAQSCGQHAAQANAKHLALVHIDSMYADKVPILIQEAQREFSGKVSAPVAGTLYTF